jgi:acyl-coenzyme A synthetase/AMP-(fatty) acid ligase
MRVEAKPAPANYLPFDEEELERSVVDRFRRVASWLGPATALSFKKQNASFDLLERRSNALASYLLDSLGPSPEPVAMFFRHGGAYNIAQLAILKARKFYVSIDPGSSAERQQLLFTDIGARMLLIDDVHEQQAEMVKGAFPELAVVNVDRLQLPDGNQAPTIGPTPDDIATIVYTSGSTGTPLGVMLTHRNMLFIARSHGRDFRLSPKDRATHVCPLWTVASSSEVFSALLNGTCLYPCSIKDAGIPEYLRLLRDERITTFTASPALFRLLFSLVKQNNQFPSVRLIRLGGDRTTKADFNLYKEVFADDCILRLGYGSSEFVLATQIMLDKNSSIAGEILPIGFPIEGCEIAILDQAGNEITDEEQGEIAIRSKYLSPGYWRGQELTEQRFRQEAGIRVRRYLTRDIGYRDSTGCLHHAGRSDAQVKIYGKFVSVSAVEKALLGVNGIRDAVVMPIDKLARDVELAAFVVLDDRQLGPPKIRADLLKVLAPELVPRRIVLLDELPLLVNNKVNRLKLKELLAV